MRKQVGFSLMEIVLVLVISGSLLVIGIRVYTGMRVDVDARRVQANVDAIFNALSAYYKVNCYGQTRANGTVIPGTLNPAFYAPASTPSIVPIDINVDLIQKGYLDANAIVLTPIVRGVGGAGTNGYVAQFNKNVVVSTRLVCIQGTGAANSPTCTKRAPVGTIVTWQAQVSAKLETTPAATPGPFLGLLGAECLSNLAGSSVTPCTGVNSGTYVVWQRNSSMASKEGSSTYWETTPTVKQFTQMYTTYPTKTLINSGGANQNYLCGN